MNDNDISKWLDGLPFLQFANKTRYHDAIHLSSHDALFGVKPKLGIALPSQAREKIVNIETEEHFEEIINTFDFDRSFVIPKNMLKRKILKKTCDLLGFYIKRRLDSTNKKDRE